MRGTATAKYLFVACLSASTVALVVVNFVLGPLALGGPSVGVVQVTADNAAASASAAPGRGAVPVAILPAPGTSLGRAAPMVVARFDSDQPAASWDDLAFVAATMRGDRGRRIVLEGHADRNGDRAYNRTLSLERARWAQARLVELGVPAERVEVIAHGADRPLTDSAVDAAVASNRRVEARWLPSAADDGDR